MSFAYRLGTAVGRFIFFCTMRLVVIRPEAARRPGAYLLACSHLSHLEPLLASIIVPRQIDWITRIEFYRHPAIARLLGWLNTIPVRRQGVPVSTIRTALDRLGRGRVVGICPEGGSSQGAGSVMNGGKIKRGVCLLACRAGVPVLPCVLLGTDKLNAVGPWLPAKRARLWVAFGRRCVEPPRDPLDRRAARRRMAEELEREFVALSRELVEACGLTEQVVREAEHPTVARCLEGSPGLPPAAMKESKIHRA